MNDLIVEGGLGLTLTFKLAKKLRITWNRRPTTKERRSSMKKDPKQLNDTRLDRLH